MDPFVIITAIAMLISVSIELTVYIIDIFFKIGTGLVFYILDTQTLLCNI